MALHWEEDPSWGGYFHAVLWIGTAERVVLIARERVTDEALRQLVEMGLTGPFAVVTAANPRGQVIPQRENDIRLDRLIERITAAGLHWLPADGGSADRAHLEQGVACRIDRDQARRLAMEFEQSAFFWFDGGEGFWLVGALADYPARPLYL